MPKFTRQNYEAVAEVLLSGKPKTSLRETDSFSVHDSHLLDVVTLTDDAVAQIAKAYYKAYANAFAEVFQNDNPRFNIDKWREAVGYDDQL